MLNRNVRKHIAEVDKRMSFLLEDLRNTTARVRIISRLWKTSKNLQMSVTI